MKLLLLKKQPAKALEETLHMNEMADRHEAHKDAQYQLLQKVKTKFSYAFIKMSK